MDLRAGFNAAQQLSALRDAVAANAQVGSLVYDATGNLVKKCTGTGADTQRDSIGLAGGSTPMRM